MTRWALVVVVLAVLSAAFAGGWYVRGLRADAAQAQDAARHEATRADSATAVTGNDRANERSAADIEAARVRRAQRREVIFDELQREVANYAKHQDLSVVPVGLAPVVGCGNRVSAGAHDRGPADADFMRIWRSANAGKFTPAEHFDTPRADAASGAAPATNRER